MRATVRVDGLDPAVLGIRHMGGRALRPEPALRSPGTLHDLKASEQRRMRKPFRPAASPDWTRRKRREGLDSRTMHAHGTLDDQLTHATGGVGVKVYNREVRFGFQPGQADADTLKKARKLAQRWRFLTIDRDAKGSIAFRVQVYIAAGHFN